MLDSKPLLLPTDFPDIHRTTIHTLQVNLGFICNQQCNHCHVNAGPNRTESMSDTVIEQVLAVLDYPQIETLDLTGGAPEMHPAFEYLVEAAVAKGKKVIDRCNLTILSEPGYEGLAKFLARHRVEVIASMPCYLEENVDAQRGKSVYQKSIEGLKQLNDCGYGRVEGLNLNLVYNPGGAYLPPSQQQLKADYKKQLLERFNIVFNDLFTITNMPIARFGSMLQSNGEFQAYLELLKNSLNPANLQTVMCRELISIDWQGFVYDCDFNQMLDMPIHAAKTKLSIADLLNPAEFERLQKNSILVGEHCYGCTAGQGSSCGGALS